jgi:hypothetical protein
MNRNQQSALTQMMSTPLTKITNEGQEEQYEGINNVGTSGASNDGISGGEGGEVSHVQSMNEFTRQLKKHKIPMSNVFNLPDTSRSYNNVELVRAANANANLQANLFNTSF